MYPFGFRHTDNHPGTYAINRRDHGDITVQQAMRVLEAYGELNKCYMLPIERQKALALPVTVIVVFTIFDAARDIGTVCLLLSRSSLVGDRC